MDTTNKKQIFNLLNCHDGAFRSYPVCIRLYQHPAAKRNAHHTFKLCNYSDCTCIPTCGLFFIGLVWMLLGLVGVPVFVGGQAGPGYLFGTYGGFSFAFIFIAILIPSFAERSTIVSVILLSLGYPLFSLMQSVLSGL